MKLRDYLFQGSMFTKCSDGSCVIGGVERGMHTNGGCHCLTSMSRTQLNILQGRLKAIGDYELCISPNQSGESDGL